jgi:hypothetical protein
VKHVPWLALFALALLCLLAARSAVQADAGPPAAAAPARARAVSSEATREAQSAPLPVGAAPALPLDPSAGRAPVEAPADAAMGAPPAPRGLEDGALPPPLPRPRPPPLAGQRGGAGQPR